MAKMAETEAAKAKQDFKNLQEHRQSEQAQSSQVNGSAGAIDDAVVDKL